jgi:hypothetical protein
VEAVIDALNAAGVFLMQKQHPNDGGVAVETIFLHESGESISAGILQVPASKQDAQGYGSALTYARRYSLMAACGIAPEDDDGNAAAKKPATPIIPAKEAGAAAGKVIGDDRKSELEELALYLVDCHKNGKDTDAIRLWYADDTFADNEERLYVWGLLREYSALRRVIKANAPQKEAA